MSQQREYLEIERRWLLNTLPSFADVPSSVCADIITVYILADPQLEVRIRRRRDFLWNITFTVVMKVGQGLMRQETPKLLVGETLFNYYLELFMSSHISEDYWKIPLPTGRKLEIKRLKGPGNLRGLVLVEIEFDGKEAAKKFGEQDFPDWLKPIIVKEVTDDSRYNGKNLAVLGRPNPA